MSVTSMSATVDDVLKALRARDIQPSRATGADPWQSHCPGCNSDFFSEEQPPLTISQNGVGPRVQCANGCEPAAILAALGLALPPQVIAEGTGPPGHPRDSDAWLQRNALLPKHSETDMGNARRLVLDHRTVRYVPGLSHRGELRYVPGLGWLWWDGTHWAPDADGAAMRAAKQTVRGILSEAKAMYAAAEEIRDPDKHVAAKKKSGERLAHAKRSQSQSRLDAMLTCASTESEFVLHADKLDSDPMLLNTPGGTIDLRTGELREHRPEDHITKLTGTTIDTEMPTPRWDDYLATTFAGDLALIDCFRRRVGYTLTGETREQCLFIAAGDGANGKTTGLETIAAAMGDYAMTVDPVTFTTAASDRAARSDIARLPGARMVLGSEIDEGAQLAKPFLKQATGGDTVVCRHLYRAEFEFRPVMKIWLTVNHLPRVGSDDHAIWRRLQVIPFSVRIRRPDKTLPRKLRAELPGILAWAVQGCLDWQRHGLKSCGAIDHEGAAYRQREDRVALFLDECCEIDSSARVESGELRDAYHAWERVRGGVPVSDLLDQLDKRGFHAGKSNGRRVRKGLRLASTDGAGSGRVG